MSRILTGITPTGNIHIGNYFGAMRPMIDMQDSDEVFVFIADLHGLNQVHDRELMKANTHMIASAYLAAGLDPQKVVLYKQSDIPAHAELALIFGSITPFGFLERSHAYKDAVANGKNVNLGLFSYPVLMAADILLYEADFVPVGRDQQQHIEYMQDIAQRFHHLFGGTFKVAEGRISDETGVLPGLDGRKMSKSYGNTIGLFDDTETVTKKVMKIATDSAGPADPKDPEKDTLFNLHKLFNADQIGELERRYRSGAITYKESKDLLAEGINRFLDPIRARKSELDANPAYVQDVLAEGRKKAAPIAEGVLQRVKERVGLA